MTSQKITPWLTTALLASGLLAACGSSQPAEASSHSSHQSHPTQTEKQPLGSVRLCGKRHEQGANSIVCQYTTNVESLYNKILIEQIKNKCTILTPTSWESCMQWPPVLWVESTSAENFNAFYEQSERIMAFYRTANSPDVTTLSYELSLRQIKEVAHDIWFRDLKKPDEVRASNQQILDTSLADILKDKGAAEGKVVQVQVAGSREGVDKVQDIINAHQLRVNELQSAFSAIVRDFIAYKAQEPIILAQLQSLSERASTATLLTLPTIQVELAQLSRAESAAPQQMQMHASRLAHQLANEDATVLEKLQPHISFMQENNLKRPHMTTASIRRLERIEAYADARHARLVGIVKKLLTGIDQRRVNLVAQAANQATRDAMTSAATLTASSQFLSQMNARVSEVGKLPRRSVKLGLYFLASKLQEHEGILQLQPSCANIVSTPWMGTGCNALSLQYSKSRTYVNSTIPNMIRLNIAAMRRAAVNETMLTEIEQHLAANRLRAATLAHDVAVVSSESL
ncbi:hypothetical protein [Corallococcus sp. M7]